MQLYTLNATSAYRQETLIESYESFIWTDRYSDVGDFEIVAEPSARNIAKLTPNVLLGFDLSDSAMIIESVQKTEDEEGKKSLLVKGRSLTSLFDNRAITTLPAGWTPASNAPDVIIRNVVGTLCSSAYSGFAPIAAGDAIPDLTVATLVTGLSAVTVCFKASDSLYSQIKQLADAYDLGLRIRTVPGTQALAFEVYKGTDRSGEGGLTFSESSETLSQMTLLDSTADYKNVACVVAPNGFRLVTAPGTTPSGLSRRVLPVDASDITTAAGATLNAQLDQRGLQALSEHLHLKMVDGTVNPNGIYKYKTHYFLGDAVNFKGSDGSNSAKRVAEYIWSYDEGGLKSYPTLTNVGGV